MRCDRNVTDNDRITIANHSLGKSGNFSNIWEQYLQIKIMLTDKLNTGLKQEINVIIWSKLFCPLNF